MLQIDSNHANEIASHALEDDPNECCGILVGRAGQIEKVYRMTNTEASPYRYKMDPREQARVDREVSDNGLEYIGFYHSHTHSPAYPSDTDVRLATGPDGMSIWPGVLYILISLMDKANPSIRAFHIEDGKVTEEEVSVDKA